MRRCSASGPPSIANRHGRVTSMDSTRRRELAGRLLHDYVHGPAAATEATARALEKAAAARAVVLVEGISDQIAVETPAAPRPGPRRGGRGGRASWRRSRGDALPGAIWSGWSWAEAGGPMRPRRGERVPARPGPGPGSARLGRGTTWSGRAFMSASRIWRTS